MAGAIVTLGLTAAVPAHAEPTKESRAYGPHVVSSFDCGFSETLGLRPGTLNFGAACFDARGTSVSIVVNDASGLNTAATLTMHRADGTVLTSRDFCTRVDGVTIPSGTAHVVVSNDNAAGQALSTVGDCNGRLAASTTGTITAIFG